MSERRIVLGRKPTDVALDLDGLLKGRLLIQGGSGSGKSYLIRYLCEHLFGQVQIIIIDPEGEFATLRERFDFVLVGPGGETPASTQTARLVAAKLLELNASAVCDIYEMSPDERHDFVREFIEALIDAPKKLWKTVLVIIDEAHMFVPERGAGDSSATNALIALATRGRKRGYVPILATQRLAKLRKDVVSELHNVLIGKTFIDIDRNRVMDTLGIERTEKDTFSHSLKKLKPGQFWAFGPALTLERQLVQIGQVITTHAELGAPGARELPPTPSNVRALMAELAELPQLAAEEASTLEDLRRAVSERDTELLKLRATVRSLEAKGAALDLAPIEQAGKAALTIVDRNATPLLEDLGHAMARIDAMRADLARELAVVVGVSNGTARPHDANSAPVLSAPEPTRTPAPSTSSRHAPTEPATNGIPSGELLILKAIHDLLPDEPDLEQLSVLTAFARSTRDAYLQRLASKGLVTRERQRVAITQEGIVAAMRADVTVKRGPELIADWRARLPEGERAIFDQVVGAWPSALQRNDIDGFKRSTRDAYVQRLARQKIVVTIGRGEVAASKFLFT